MYSYYLVLSCLLAFSCLKAVEIIFGSKQLNQKIKDLIAGDYSQVLDMQGNTEITNITNNLNDLSEVIRLTQENLEQESKRLHSILSYMTDGGSCNKSSWSNHYD